MHDEATELGVMLKAARELQDLSLRKAADMAAISPTYLSQLEHGAVKDPSPHVLYKLAQGYQIAYEEVMRAAGYIVPAASATHQGVSPLEAALRMQQPLTPDEREALMEYLAWYRSRHGRPPEHR